ncbi:extracellular solute-binding protein [Paenibacillus thalictri]|uniref:Extracellular solute-binding protein n=2 Tax=Paenibacillus thalictri TaxID=2527873 RepID=A0A4Q9DGT3_9BACL|nr:extracellular solute-binding protein [Paenibacillus thalictri]
MTASLLAGCGGTGTGTGAGSAPAGNAPTTDNSKPKEAEKPGHVTMVYWNDYKYPDGLDDNNNPYLDYMKKGTNLDIKVITAPNSGYKEKLNVIMASGDLPDLMFVNDPSLYVNYLNQKALKPLNAAIDKFGPDLKKLIPQEAWDSVTVDGKIYAIPTIADIQSTELMWVRKDWLDQLKLPEPKTLDDYVKTAKAFATLDPDGNGKNDTVGWLIGENLSGTGPIFGAFGVQRGQWVERGGQLVYSSTLPEMKEALKFLNGLYNDKVIDPEWALSKSKTVEEKVGSGKAGLYSGPWHARRGAILTSQQNNPKAVWKESEFPVGKDGKFGVQAGPLLSGFNVVPATSKNEESVVKLLNFMIGKGFSDLELGFEGQIWNRKDGKVVTNFEEHNKHVYRNSLSRIIRPSDSTIYFDKLKSLGEDLKLVDNIEKINKVLMYSKFTGIPGPVMSKNSAKLQKLEDETFTKIVMGTIPVDDFDKFVDTWKKDGGSDVAKEVNDWYASRKK